MKKQATDSGKSPRASAKRSTMKPNPLLVRKGTTFLIAFSMLLVGLTFVPTGQADDLGDRVFDGDNDHVPVLESLSGTDYSTHQVCRISADDAGILDDEFYIHWEGNCDEVDRGDIRLTSTSGGNAGSVVASGDSDRNREFDATFVTDLPSNVGYLEADGEPGLTADDWIYLSDDSSLDASNADIRLTSTEGGSAGTIVDSSSDSDIDEANQGDDDEFPISTSLNEHGQFALRFYDADGNDRFDPADETVFLVQHTGRDFASVNDVPLSSASDPSFGDKLSSSSDFVPVHLIDISDSANLATTDEVTSPRNDRHLFIHFDDDDDDDNAILRDSIILTAGSGNLGDRVTSESQGQGEAIPDADSITPLMDEIFWLDVNSDEVYTPGTDPVYLDRPSSMDGESGDDLSAGDLRLTDIDDHSEGTVVESDDGDLTAYGSLTVNNGDTNGAWFLMLDDADTTNATQLERLSNGKAIGGDSDWDEGVDGAYISSSNTVSDGDLRLYTDHNLANSELQCDNDVGNHSDCGTSLTNQTRLRSTSSSPSYPGTTPVYYDANNNSEVDSGDQRIYHPNLEYGTVSSSDDDTGEDLHNVTKLRASSLSQHFEGAWADDDVYFDDDDDEEVSNGDVRLYLGSWSETVDTSASCDSNPIDDDCNAPLNSDNDIKVTGTDGQYESAQSEYVYYSGDDIVNEADFRFLPYGGESPGDVARGDEDWEQLSVSSNDRLFLSWCSGDDTAGDCATDGHPTNRVRVGDIAFDSGTSVVEASDSDYDTELTRISGVGDQGFKRYDRGDSGQVTDDGFYLSFRDSITRLGEDDIRLIPVIGESAGSMVASGDSEELSSTVSRADNPFEQYVEWADVDGSSGYTQGDPVYLDTSNIFGSDSGLSHGDIRITEAEASGDTLAAGSLVLSSDSDRVAYDFDTSGSPDWNLYWHDADRDGNVDDGEQVYVNPNTATGNVPSILSIRMSGETSGSSGGGGGGGGSGGGGGGGGGGDTTTPPAISITQPDAGATFAFGDEVEITGTSTQGDATLDIVAVTVGDEDLTVEGVSSWSSTWTADEAGDHTIRATVTDTEGETATDSITVTVEEAGPEGPTVTIDSPEDGATANIGEQVTLTGTTAPGDAAITSLRLTANDRALPIRGLADWTGTWTPQQPGEATVQVTARDADGHTGTDTINVTVEGQLPTVTITSPEDGAEVAAGESVTIEGTATAGSLSLSTVTVNVNGENLEVDGVEEWSTEWTPEEQGDYEIEATATDEGDITASDSATVTVTAPTPAPGALILATVLASAALAIRRKR